MLALITQTKVQRTWLQYGAEPASIHAHLKRIIDKGCAQPARELPQQPSLVKGQKRMSSRIPRIIRNRDEQKDEEEQQLNMKHLEAAEQQVQPVVVRSTRTSRCRIKLTHPDWAPSSRSSSISSMPCEELLLRFECCDQKQVNIPSQLINRYSSLLADWQKEPYFSYNQTIGLDAIRSTTMLRLILWMEQHFQDDLLLLERTLLSHEHLSWDKRFLGHNLEAVLELLLAANFLGIHPLMEVTMIYFYELIDERNTTKRNCMKHLQKTLYNQQQPLGQELP